MNSAYSVGEYPIAGGVGMARCHTLLRRNPWEERDSHRTHGTHGTSCRERTPTDGTDAHRCRRVWHPCHTHATKFCVFCEFCGRTAHHKYLCKSVKSVGGHLSRRFCEFGVFCGRISHSRWRGYGKMPYPPKEKSVGGKRFPQNARNSQKLLAEKSLPQMARMFTDIGGYGIPAIPTLPNSVNSVGEQRTLSICVNL